MINILITEIGEGYGGSAAYLYSFLKFLDKTRFNPVVVFYHYAEGPFIRKIIDLGVETVFINNKNKKNIHKLFPLYVLGKTGRCILFLVKIILQDIPTAVKLVFMIRRRGISILLLNSEVYVNLPAVLASRLTRIPCLVRKSGTGTDIIRRIQRISSLGVDCFIASSEYEAIRHKQNRIPYKRMEIVYEGVDISQFKPNTCCSGIREEFGITPNDCLVGTISRIDDGKGHDDLLKAVAVVINRLSTIKFLIVGDDCGVGGKTTLSELKKLANALGVQKNVIFTGWRNDISDILQTLDIFVHCPNNWHEGMGIATLEAQACGKPVIITNNAGLAETTIDGFNGFIIPVGDYITLADKIILLSEEKALRLKMGVNSRKNIEDRFDISRTVANIEKIILSYLIPPPINKMAPR